VGARVSSLVAENQEGLHGDIDGPAPTLPSSDNEAPEIEGNNRSDGGYLKTNGMRTLMDRSLNAPKHVFGPVPSRRLGRSLGIDLVPYKTCTFDCIYCDLGRTTHKTTSRQLYVPPEEMLYEFERTLSGLDKKPDFITLSGSGEPTLNTALGEVIREVKEITSIPVAVLTNSSLLSLEEVRKDVSEADLVVPSLDAVTPALFEYINRPHPSIKIEEIISGLVQFRKSYRGQLWLEILFCRGVNDGSKEIEKLREAAERIEPDRIQLNTPVRPPAEDFAFPLTSAQLEEIRKRLGDKAEIISEWTAPSGETVRSALDSEILNLIKRRPCTAEDITKALGLHLGEVVKCLERLLKEGGVHYRMYEHRGFYENVSTS
jgi:wyosine [tRNA(Phe)-imidazoG37] synthetase (radical SAM superfamily)